MSLAHYEKYIAQLLPDTADQQAFFDHLERPLTKSINIIQTRIKTADLIARQNPLGRQLTDTKHPELTNIFYIDREDRSLALGKHRLHQAGFFYMQEVAASIPPHFMDITPNSLILDMCAAPGGKSIQLADRMMQDQPENIGGVWSNDVDPKRIKVLHGNINRTGLRNSAVSKINGNSFGKVFPETFNAILLDAPCGGEGTGFKSESAFRRWKKQGVLKIANVQRQLLISALKACKVGGSIIFSTCTINHRENENNLTRLLQEYGYCVEIEDVHMTGKSPALTHFQQEELLTDSDAQKCVRCRPHKQKTGGFFISKIRKTGRLNNFDDSFQGNFSTPLTHNPQLQKTMQKWLTQEFGITIDPQQHYFVQSAKKVFLCSPTIVPFIKRAKFEKIGIPVAKPITNGFTPLQGLASALGHLATINTCNITPQAAQKYTLKENLTIDDIVGNTTDITMGRYYILKVENLPFSVTKYTQDILKNKFIGI